MRVSPDFHQAVEFIGKRWTGAILWALSERAHYYAELTQVVPGLSDRLLSRRLRELESEGLVERSVHAGTPARVSYALTDKGKALRPAIRELRAWAQRWNGTHAGSDLPVPRGPRWDLVPDEDGFDPLDRRRAGRLVEEVELVGSESAERGLHRP